MTWPSSAAPQHDLPAVEGRGAERFHGREAQVGDEVLEVLGIGPVLDPGESVVAAGQHADAALVHLLQRLAGDLQLAVIAHGLRRLRRDAPLGGVERGVDQPRDAGGHEVPILPRLQHVERFLVGEARVVDDLDAVAHALLHRLRRAGVGGHALAAQVRLLHRDRDLLVGHRRELRGDARDVLAGEVQLHGVHPVLEEHPHRLPHLLGAVDDGAEAELRIGQVRQRLVARGRRAR